MENAYHAGAVEPGSFLFKCLATHFIHNWRMKAHLCNCLLWLLLQRVLFLHSAGAHHYLVQLIGEAAPFIVKAVRISWSKHNSGTLFPESWGIFCQRMNLLISFNSPTICLPFPNWFAMTWWQSGVPSFQKLVLILLIECSNMGRVGKASWCSSKKFFPHAYIFEPLLNLPHLDGCDPSKPCLFSYNAKGTGFATLNLQQWLHSVCVQSSTLSVLHFKKKKKLSRMPSNLLMNVHPLRKLAADRNSLSNISVACPQKFGA